MAGVTRSILRRLSGFFREEMSEPELRARLSDQQEPPAGITIVALIAHERDRELLSRLAVEHKWTLHLTATCGEAWDVLNKTQAPIVLCDRDLPATEWRGVIQMMVSAKHPVYAILVSKVADDYLWNEVIRHGGHDLLAAPIREPEVLRAIRLAWSYWNNSMRLPPMLIKHYL